MHAETPAEIHTHESIHTEDGFQSLVNVYKYLQCILKKKPNKKKDKVHVIL